MFSREIVFDFEKETPGTLRYKERVPDDSQPTIGTLYIRKAALGSKRPMALLVVVEAGE